MTVNRGKPKGQFVATEKQASSFTSKLTGKGFSKMYKHFDKTFQDVK